MLDAAVFAAGLGLALWLSLMRAHPPGCGNSSACGRVLLSKFSEFLGLPLAWWASGIWVCVILLKEQRLRAILLGLFAAGSCVLLGIQVLYIHALCPYCLAHAALTWLAYFRRDHKPTAVILPAVIMGAVVFWLGSQHHQGPDKPIMAGALRQEFTEAAFYWLGPRTSESPVLVLDLRCQACVEILRKLATGSAATSPPPGIIFQTNGDNDLTVSFVTAVLSRQDGPQNGFPKITKKFLDCYDAIMAEPESGRQSASSLLLLESASLMPLSKERLRRQRMLLAKSGIAYTPTYIDSEGNIRSGADSIR